MSLLKITRGKRGFKITTTNGNVQRRLELYGEELIQPKIERQRGKVTVVPGDKFYVHSKRHNSYYFINTHYHAIMELIDNYCRGSGLANIDVVEEDVMPCDGTDVDFSKHTLNLVEPDGSDFDYQNPIVAHTSREGHNHNILEVQTGMGKCQDMSSKIKIPGGWTTMGEIQVGDTITAVDGGTTKVTGIFPQGKKEVFELTFGDGRTARACGDHLWRVFHPNWVPMKDRTAGTIAGQTELGWRVVDTNFLIDALKSAKGNLFSVQLIESEKIDDVDLPIDPWLLGALLGDGSLCKTPAIASTFDEFIDKVESLVPNDTCFVRDVSDVGKHHRFKRADRNKECGVLSGLEQLGLRYKRAWNKFIPEIYLNASHGQRLKLLQGLMDSDGEVDKPKVSKVTGKTPRGGSIRYSTTSEQLANDVAYLVRSLGGLATIRGRQTYHTYKGVKKAGRPSWRVNIRMRNPKSALSMSYKSERTCETNRYSETLRLRISSIVPVSYEECQCISVDHPTHLYVTDDFVVTHNTAMAMKSIVNIGKRTLIITKPGYIEKWTGDLTGKNYSLSLRPGELIRIGGDKGSSSKMEEMDALIEMGRNGELDGGKGRKECKVILISSKTFDNWIKHQLENDVEQVFEQFMEITGCGKLLYDESHEWFRMNYWTFLLLNPARALDLSATLIPGDDVFIKHRYDERFPKICRYNDLEYDRYIDALGIYYHTTDKKIIDRMNRMKLYNHIEFEKMIMKRKGSQEAYFIMVKELIDMFYKNKKWEKGQRALIFFASREMCTRFTEYAKNAYPDLNVKRHIQGDNYDEFVKADLGVSTPGKSGTAVDIPGLVLTIVTVCLSKEDKNLQILGRTRKVRDWDLSPKAIFLHCQQLVKHLVYLKRRQKMFRNKVQSFKILNSKFIIK